MNELKGVSIIIPTYNRPDMLQESLRNLKLRTSYEPKEIVIVDGGSEPNHVEKYQQMKNEGLYDKIILLPHRANIPVHELTGCVERAYKAGIDNSNPAFPYMLLGADDLFYRTGWTDVLVDMLDSEWAEKYKVRIISGFNHWAAPGDYEKMKQYVPEMYKSKDGKVEGYVSEWGGNWFLNKRFFNEIGGFVNNLKKEKVPLQYAHSYEAVMQYKGYEFGWKWGTTVDTYVQTMARPGSSSLGNYRRDENGQLVTNEQFNGGIAIGVNWKDE
jgi:glycosyltransferase involved in cell wall biosynthesis